MVRAATHMQQQQHVLLTPRFLPLTKRKHPFVRKAAFSARLRRLVAPCEPSAARNLSTRAFLLGGALNEALSLLLQGPLSTVPNDLRAPKRFDHLLVKPLLSRWTGGTTAPATRQQQPEGPQPATAGGRAPSPRPFPDQGKEKPRPVPPRAQHPARLGSARLGRADPSTRTPCGLRAEPLRPRRRRRPPFEEPPLPPRGLPPPLSPGGSPPALRLTLAMLLR